MKLSDAAQWWDIGAEAILSVSNAALNICLQIKNVESKAEVPSAFEFTSVIYLAGLIAFVWKENVNGLK